MLSKRLCSVALFTLYFISVGTFKVLGEIHLSLFALVSFLLRCPPPLLLLEFSFATLTPLLFPVTDPNRLLLFCIMERP